MTSVLGMKTVRDFHGTWLSPTDMESDRRERPWADQHRGQLLRALASPSLILPTFMSLSLYCF